MENIQVPFTVKAMKKLGIERYIKNNKNYLQYTYSNSGLHGRKLRTCPLVYITKRMSTSFTFTQNSLEIFARGTIEKNSETLFSHILTSPEYW